MIVHSRELLNLKQITEGIAPINEKGYIDWSATFMDPSPLLRECRALLTIDDWGDNNYGDPAVGFCHYTVKVRPRES